MDVADLDAVMAAMQTPAMAEAMEYDGVLADHLGDPRRGVVPFRKGRADLFADAWLPGDRGRRRSEQDVLYGKFACAVATCDLILSG